MKKLAAALLICFAAGCSNNTVSVDSSAVYITKTAESENVIYDENMIKFVMNKQKRGTALLTLSSNGTTPNTIIMPFSASGIGQLRGMLEETILSDEDNVPLDIIKNNRGDYLSCVVMHGEKESYVMCELYGTTPKDSAKHWKTYFTMDFDDFYELTNVTELYISGKM